MLTIAITTSPIESHPETSVLSTVVSSISKILALQFKTLQENDLTSVKLIVTFDGPKSVSLSPGKQHIKSGRIGQDLAERYQRYKQAAKDLLLSTFVAANNISFPDQPSVINQETVASLSQQYPDHVSIRTIYRSSSSKLNLTKEHKSLNVPQIIETTYTFLSTTSTVKHELVFLDFAFRFGFALSVREALQLTTTEYIMVVQHDWELLLPNFDIVRLMQTMSQHQDVIKYVGLPSSATIRIADRGWKTRQLPELGCDGTLSPRCDICNDEPLTKEQQLERLKYELENDLDPLDQTKGIPFCYVDPPQTATNFHPPCYTHPFTINQLPFIRLYFWYDKPHIASTKYYKEQVFGKGYFKRGDFIEDVFGQYMMNDIRASYLDKTMRNPSDTIPVSYTTTENEQKEWNVEAAAKTHLKYGCWLYYPNHGLKRYLYHVDGRHYLTKDMKSNLVAKS